MGETLGTRNMKHRSYKSNQSKENRVLQISLLVNETFRRSHAVSQKEQKKVTFEEAKGRS